MSKHSPPAASGLHFCSTTDPLSHSQDYDRLDIVLFTLLHETAHIVRGDLEKHGGSIIDEEDQPHTLGDEDETDKLAAHWMLPSAIPPAPGRISQQWVTRTAEAMGVHPIVIVGRLQRLEVIPWRTTLVKNAPNVTPYLKAGSACSRAPVR